MKKKAKAKKTINSSSTDKKNKKIRINSEIKAGDLPMF